MPAVFLTAIVGAAGAAASAFAVGITITSAIIWTGALVSVGLSLVTNALVQKPKSPNLSLGNTSDFLDTRALVRVAHAPARWILGTARVGGVIAHIKIIDNVIHMAIIVSEGALTELKSVYINGDGGALSGTNYEVIPYFAADGSDGAAFRTVIGDPNFKLFGKSWVYVKLTQPKYQSVDDRFWSSIPKIEFLIKGIKISWPGQTVPIWTANAAAIRYWWLTSRRGLPIANVDIASFTAAFAYCGAGNRYEINGVIQSGETVGEVENQMDFAWAGNAPEANGKIYFFPGAPRTSSFSIGPDDIISTDKIVPQLALQSRYNTVTCALEQSISNAYSKFELPEFVDQQALSRDKTTLRQSLGVKRFVNDPAVAQLNIVVLMRQLRQQQTFTYTIKPGANMIRHGIVPGHVITLTDPIHGIASMQMRVVSTGLNPNFSITLVMTPYNPLDYNRTTGLPAIAAPVIAPAPAGQLSALSALTVTKAAIVEGDGTALWDLKIDWASGGATMPVVVVHTGPDKTVTNFTAGNATNLTIKTQLAGTHTIVAFQKSFDGRISLGRTATIATSHIVDFTVDPPQFISNQTYGNIIRWVTAPVVKKNIDALEIRYTRKNIGSSTVLLPLTDANWAMAGVMGVVTVSPNSNAGVNFITADTLIPGTGHFRIFARYLSRAGTYSDIAEVGAFTFSIPASQTYNPPTWPIWAGYLRNMAILALPQDDSTATGLLIAVEALSSTTRGEFDGNPWPLGPGVGNGVALPAADGTPLPGSANYSAYAITEQDLGASKNIEVIINVETYRPPPAPGTVDDALVMDVDVYFCHNSTTDARGYAVRQLVPANGSIFINGIRRWGILVHVKATNGFAIARVSPQIRVIS